MIPIVPAIIPKSQMELQTILPLLKFSPEIHIDVVDGKYVSQCSWPYIPKGDPLAIKHLTDSFTLEVDLMVLEPILAGEEWLRAGADMLVFHTDNITPTEFEKFVLKSKATVSIASTPDNALDKLLPYLSFAQGVQLMGIAKVGAQGQPFASEVLDIIKDIKKIYSGLPITIDGSVNKDTIVRLKEAGADRFICGSAIVQQSDPYLAYQLLKTYTDGTIQGDQIKYNESY